MTYGPMEYPAAEVARGAAYELFSEYPADGFLPNPRGSGGSAWHRFGRLRGEGYEAVADPPGNFRILAMTRAARFPVDSLTRRTQYATWRGVLCTVLREEADWLRLRMCRPVQEHVVAVAAQCYERGIYELWAPAAEVTDRQTIDVEYALPPGRADLPRPRPESLDG